MADNVSSNNIIDIASIEKGTKIKMKEILVKN